MKHNAADSTAAPRLYADSRRSGQGDVRQWSGESVSAVFLRLLQDHARPHGVALDDMLDACGIAPAVLRQPEAQVDCSQFVRLCSMVSAALAEPALGMVLGAAIEPAHLGPYGLAIISCDTPRATLDYIARYSRLMLNAGDTVFVEQDGVCMRYWCRNGTATDAANTLLADLVFAVFVTMSRHAGPGAARSLRWVSFRHPAPANVQPYAAMFNCELRFNAADNVLCFDAGYLDQPMRHSHPQVRAAMDALCARLLAQMAQASEPDWQHQCRTAIASALRNGHADLDQVAASLHLSPSTLRRRLAAQATSFRAMVDDLRRELALDYLRQPDMGLVDVAFLLGFSEQSAFQRAFKRWTGATPGDYRRQLQQSASATGQKPV